MTKDEEARLLELLRDAYDIIEALNNPDYRDRLDEALELSDTRQSRWPATPLAALLS